MDATGTATEPAPHPAIPPPPEPPGYRIEKELGRGGMGVVYKAWQVALNRPVALKMILAGGHASTGDLARFRIEAAAIAQVPHPNIVQVYETGEHNGLPYISFEYCPGGSLDRQLGGRPVKPKEAAALIETLAGAIGAAHAVGIVHRDLKPANILLGKPHDANTKELNRSRVLNADAGFTLQLTSAQPKVTDFGLAKRLGDDSSATRTGTIMGTPSYMAPEQAAGRIREIGPAADLYALGAILYELLTGRPPFRAASAFDTVKQVLTGEPVSPHRLQPGTPRDLETICLKCLEKEPAKRYATAQDLAADLRRYLNGEPIQARPISFVGRGWRWCHRHPVVAGSILTTVALGAVCVFGLLSVAAGRREQVRDLALRSTASDARHVASTVLLRLQSIGSLLERAASDDELQRLLRTQDRKGLHTHCETLATRADVQAVLRGDGPDPVASWMVLGPDATILAVSHEEAIRTPRVPGRDYYHGAMEAARVAGKPAVHLSRGYRSTNQQLDKFALSIVVTDPTARNQPLGVLVVTLGTTATLGPKAFDNDQEVVLALPRDTSNPATPTPVERPEADYLIVVHPAYQPRQEPVRLPASTLPLFAPDFGRELQPPREDVRLPPTDQYFDPAATFDSRYAGRWLAGFAPVGNTELVVIVQQSFDHAQASDRALFRQIGQWIGATVGLGATATLGLLALRLRAQRAGAG